VFVLIGADYRVHPRIRHSTHHADSMRSVYPYFADAVDIIVVCIHHVFFRYLVGVLVCIMCSLDTY